MLRLFPKTTSTAASYFFNSRGWLQQHTVPFPARVTINSFPHFKQTYLFPT